MSGEVIEITVTILSFLILAYILYTIHRTPEGL